MKTLYCKTAIAFILASTITTASATIVTADISYKTLGLNHTEWLSDGHATVSAADNAWLTQDDLPEINQDRYYLPVVHLNANSNNNGSMETSARLTVGGLATSISTWTDTIINNSGASNNYSMNVALTDIFFRSGGYTDSTLGREFLTGYKADVLVNGVSVWSSAQTLKHIGTDISIVKSGFDIGEGILDLHCERIENGCEAELSLVDYFGLVNLGTFSHGQQFDVSYVLSSFAYWNDPNGCAWECAGAHAIANDPFAIDGNRIVSSAIDVPEPGTIAMILPGLALLGLSIRRRHQ